MSNKLLNSALVSSEELWRTRRVLSSDDTQPHSIIVKYSPPSEWENVSARCFLFFFFFRERSFKSGPNPRVDFS